MLRTKPPQNNGGRARISVALVMLAALAGCGTPSKGTESTGRSGTELVWGKAVESDVLDPALSGTGAAWEFLGVAYENLVGLDDNLKLVPRLAQSWQQVSPTEYVFTLRGDVKFSNGRMLTPDDVVGSLQRVMDPKVAASWASQLNIAKVRSSGPSQVTVTLKKPRTSFLAALAGTPAAIVPMKELTAGTYDPKKELLGTGPFKVAKHSQNESWTFARNPYYWRPGLPKVEKLTVKIMPEESARIAALRDGSIDITTFEVPDSIRLLKGQANVKSVVQSTTDFYRVDVNAKTSVFADDRLREAVSLSIDRNRIRDVALAGVGRSTAAVPVAFGGCDPAALPFATPDIQRARELVKAAGATGKTVKIGTTANVPMSPPIAQVLQQNLQAAGLKVGIVNQELGAAVKSVREGTFDLRVGWFAGYADPSMVLPWWNPELAAFNKVWAKSDADLNALIDRATSRLPGPERVQALRDACGRIARDGVMIPLVSKDAIVAYRTDQIAVHIPALEGYAVPLRRLAEFTAK
jgi:peptide/nickel transport system substrate-binding protein